MVQRARLTPPLLYAALFLGVLLLSGVGGYVYSHEPQRDTLLLQIERTPEPAPDAISGSVVAIDGGSLTLAQADGSTVMLALSADVPVEDLARLEAAIPDGSPVNVGVDNTQFGQVLTGVVWVGSQ